MARYRAKDSEGASVSPCLARVLIRRQFNSFVALLLLVVDEGWVLGCVVVPLAATDAQERVDGSDAE